MHAVGSGSAHAAAAAGGGGKPTGVPEAPAAVGYPVTLPWHRSVTLGHPGSWWSCAGWQHRACSLARNAAPGTTTTPAALQAAAAAQRSNYCPQTGGDGGRWQAAADGISITWGAFCWELRIVHMYVSICGWPASVCDRHSRWHVHAYCGGQVAVHIEVLSGAVVWGPHTGRSGPALGAVKGWL
jgi:hypothetical protein